MPSCGPGRTGGRSCPGERSLDICVCIYLNHEPAELFPPQVMPSASAPAELSAWPGGDGGAVVTAAPW